MALGGILGGITENILDPRSDADKAAQQFGGIPLGLNTLSGVGPQDAFNNFMAAIADSREELNRTIEGIQSRISESGEFGLDILTQNFLQSQQTLAPFQSLGLSAGATLLKMFSGVSPQEVSGGSQSALPPGTINLSNLTADEITDTMTAFREQGVGFPFSASGPISDIQLGALRSGLEQDVDRRVQSVIQNNPNIAPEDLERFTQATRDSFLQNINNSLNQFQSLTESGQTALLSDVDGRLQASQAPPPGSPLPNVSGIPTVGQTSGIGRIEGLDPSLLSAPQLQQLNAQGQLAQNLNQFVPQLGNLLGQATGFQQGINPDDLVRTINQVRQEDTAAFAENPLEALTPALQDLADRAGVDADQLVSTVGQQIESDRFNFRFRPEQAAQNLAQSSAITQQFGQQGLNLQSLSNQQAQTPQEFANSTLRSLFDTGTGAVQPFIDALVGQGTRAIRNSAAARGLSGSGRTLAELNELGIASAAQQLSPVIQGGVQLALGRTGEQSALQRQLLSDVLQSGTGLSQSALDAQLRNTLTNNALGIDARGQTLQAATNVRGQDITQRGQDVQDALGRLQETSRALQSLTQGGLSGAQSRAQLGAQLGGALTGQSNLTNALLSEADLSRLNTGLGLTQQAQNLQFQGSLTPVFQAPQQPSIGRQLLAGLIGAGGAALGAGAATGFGLGPGAGPAFGGFGSAANQSLFV